MKRLSIQANLILLAVVAALPFIAIGIYNAYREANSDIEDATLEAQRGAETIATDTAAALNSAKGLLADISTRPLVKALDPQHCDAIFESFRGLFPQYTNLLTVRGDARRACSAVAPPPGAPAEVDPELYLSATLRNRAFTLGKVTRGVFTRRWILVAAQPLLDDAGRPSGVIGLTIDLARLQVASDPADIPPNALARIVDDKGIVLASSTDPQLWIGKNVSDLAWFRLLDPKAPAVGNALDSDGVAHIFSTIPIAGSPWHVAVSLPPDILYAPVLRRLKNTIAFSLAALALAALLAYLIARRTARPVEAIAKSARQAALSPASARMPVEVLSWAPAEIQSLAADFESMLKARSATELQLRDSEERFRQMAESIDDAFFLRSADGSRMLYISPAYENIWQRSRKSLYENPRSWTDAIHSDDQASALEKAQAVNFDIEFRVMRPDGSIRWIKSRGFPVHDADGNVMRIAGIAQDITDRKLSEQELHESERRFSSLLDNVELASVMLDNDARITYCNDYLLRLTGWRLDEVIGGDWYALFLGAKPGSMTPTFQSILAAAFDAWHRENEIFTRSGERRHMRWNNSVLRSVEGKTIGVACIGEDITERKRAEQALELHVARLEVLRDMNMAILAARSPPEIAAAGLRSLGRIVPFWGATAMSFDLPANMATVLALERGPGAGYNAGTAISLDDYGQTDLELLKQGRMCVVEDLGAIHGRSPTVENLYSLGMRSYVRIPLMAEGALVGALNLAGSEPVSVTTEQAAFARQLADKLAIGLQQALLRERIERLNRVYAVLSGINTLIVRVRDRDELFREACRIAVEQGRLKTAMIGTIDREAMRIAQSTSAGEEADLLKPVEEADSLHEDAPMGNTMVARAIRENRAIVANDVHSDIPMAFRRAIIDRGILAIAVLPLLVSGDAVGVFVLMAGERGFFDEEQMKLLLELAGDIAFAMDTIEKRGRLDYLAYYDQLTGLANRGLFLERLAQYKRSATAAGHKLALMLIDLERFKSINDSFGRPAGDRLLKEVASWLTANVGGAELLARLDADHFALVVPELRQEDDLGRLVQSKQQALLNHPFQVGDAVLRVAAKAGVVVFPDDGDKADILLRNAEAALKQAKAGGEPYLFYARRMTEARAIALTLENQLRAALENEEFVLHYQPKVTLLSGKVTSAEALIRWNDPRTGLVPPGRFIPVLEETGLIHQVGRWALRRAVADYLRWQAAGLPAVRIAVNVSSLQLRSRDFIDEVRQVISIDAWAAAGLELEITESLIMEDVGHNIDSLRAIRELGVTVAIDDFGTGFSSLAYLAKLPVDTLKIDRTFVTEMTAGPEGLALVSTIINLAHSLKLKVVAEGVETEEQLSLLRLLKCEEMQGFLFSKAVPSEIFETKFLVPALAH